MEFERHDTESLLKMLKRDIERSEDKLDHLTTMAEKETRRCLRERKEEHLRKQGGQKKPMKSRDQDTGNTVPEGPMGRTIGHAG